MQSRERKISRVHLFHRYILKSKSCEDILLFGGKYLYRRSEKPKTLFSTKPIIRIDLCKVRVSFLYRQSFFSANKNASDGHDSVKIEFVCREFNEYFF